jgi:hypothetical protein
MSKIRTRATFAIAAIAFATLFSPSEACAQAAGNRGKTYRAPNVKRNVQARRPATVKPNNVGRYNSFQPGYGTAVSGGQYVPGYGVMGGYPGGYSTFGGTYAPGFGVMGTPGAAVSGGTFIPGYGVTGSAIGSQKVQGGTYIPGYGVH